LIQVKKRQAEKPKNLSLDADKHGTPAGKVEYPAGDCSRLSAPVIVPLWL